MRIDLVDVTAGEGADALRPTTVGFESGSVTLVATETAQRPTLLALIASGRMIPEHGSVTRDPEVTGDELRASVAVVDAPDISEPAAGLRLDGIVQEELMFAELPSSSKAVLSTLDTLGARDFARTPIEHVPVTVRLHVLAELAAMREDVDALVLTSPDRHGGDPLEWYPVAEGLAERGYAVLVIAGAASVALLDAALAEPEPTVAPKHVLPPEPEDASPEAEPEAEAEPELELEPEPDTEPEPDPVELDIPAPAEEEDTK
jgi:hypothetical protein